MDSNSNRWGLMNHKLEIAGIATDEKRKLVGFKVLGVFPFYLTYIRTGTHVQLCAIKESIQKLIEGEPKVSDFNDYKLQKELEPLIREYILIALVNNRLFGWFFKWALNRKLKSCGHYHILSLYSVIQQMNQPAFFLSYWNSITQVDNTLLKEVKQS